MTTLWGDVETFSECDLKSAGTHAYAEHTSTRVIVWQWAVDDGAPVVEDLSDGALPSEASIALLLDPSVVLVFHNSAFDRTLLRHCWGIDVPVTRWRDTMAQAMAHGLPGGLDKVGACLDVDMGELKDKRGKELIQLFCKPRPKNAKLRRATRETHPKEWAEFLEYSRQDIVAMRAIHRKLPIWNYKGEWLEQWRQDQRINDRGFAVDVELAEAAVKAAERETARLKRETVAATDGAVASVSQRDELLAHILAFHGVTLPDLKADTLRRRMEDPELPDPVKLLIGIRLEATKASTAKYKALSRAVSADGRLRNTLQWCGAQRTGRWAGRIFQPQNMPRPSKGFKLTEQTAAVYCIKEGIVGDIFPSAMQAIADTVRGCIVAAPGRKLVISDLANIEGRMLAWLGGERWKVKAFAEFDAGEGADMYCQAYARAFNTHAADVDDYQRQIGKVMELGLGYQGGVAAFLTFAAVYNMDLGALADAVWSTAPLDKIEEGKSWWTWARKKHRTLGLTERVYVACQVLVLLWREAHPCTTALWGAADEGVRLAIQNPGVTYDIGDHLKARRDGSWLRLRLPSGRYLCYLKPQVDGDGISYFGVSQYTRQWTRLRTYGGKLIENATQGAAKDVLAHNMPAVEEAGYPIVLTVHDELLTEPEDDPRFTAATLSAMMAVNPPWAQGLPLAAKGFETQRYRKE